MLDFIYSSIILCDIFGNWGIHPSKLSDKRLCKLMCFVAYPEKPPDKGYCNKHNYEKYRHVIDLFLTSLNESVWSTLFREHGELISYLLEKS